MPPLKNCVSLMICSSLLLPAWCHAHSLVAELDYAQGQSPHKIRGVSNYRNPASADFRKGLLPSDKLVEMQLKGIFAAEYGDVDDLFDRIDSLAAAYESSAQDNGEPVSGGDELSFDIDDPDFEVLVEDVARTVTRLAGFTALIATEGYARAEVKTALSLLANRSLLGGTFKIEIARHTFASAVGLAEELSFDVDTALTELQAAFDIGPTDPPTRFDLTGGVSLVVDPAAENVAVELSNDSLLLTKGARITDYSVNFSNVLWQPSFGTLYWGVTPIFRQIGLTNVAVRLGDLTDSKELFEQIDDTRFQTDSHFTLDAGLLWVHRNYSLGAQIQDLHSTTYRFPGIDQTRFSSDAIINQLNREGTVKTKPQLTLEGSSYAASGRWVLSGSVQASPVYDPLRQEFQWLALRGDMFFNSRLFTSAKLSLQRNLQGSELTYVTLGAHVLRFFDLSIATTVENTQLDGDSLPRGLNVNIGFKLLL